MPAPTLTKPTTPPAEQPSAQPNCGTACGIGSGSNGLSEWVMPPEATTEAMKRVMAAVNSPEPLPYDTPPEADPANPWLARQLAGGFYTALQLCFEQLPAEPKHIIHIGGCQQADLARRLGFLLPFAGITVTDTDADVVRVTEEAIHCRLGFEHAPLPTLPMATDSADVIVMPNMGQAPLSAQDWPALVTECRRVLRPSGALIMSAYRPVVGGLLHALPGGKHTHRLLQMVPVAPPLPWQAMLSVAKQYGGSLQLALRPLPWHMAMVTMA